VIADPVLTVIAVLLTLFWIRSVAEQDGSALEECPLKEVCPWAKDKECDCRWKG